MRTYSNCNLVTGLTVLALVASFKVLKVAGGNNHQQDNEINNDGRHRLTIRCVSGNDCGQNECSVMGMQRYSEPRCEIRGQLGAPCRPYQEATNKTLSFPHFNMECEHVYMQFCPCAKGLACVEAECRPVLKAPSTVNSLRLPAQTAGIESRAKNSLQRQPQQLNRMRPQCALPRNRSPFSSGLGGNMEKKSKQTQ